MVMGKDVGSSTWQGMRIETLFESAADPGRFGTEMG